MKWKRCLSAVVLVMAGLVFDVFVLDLMSYKRWLTTQDVVDIVSRDCEVVAFDLFMIVFSFLVVINCIFSLVDPLTEKLTNKKSNYD